MLLYKLKEDLHAEKLLSYEVTKPVSFSTQAEYTFNTLINLYLALNRYCKSLKIFV